jgi:hypothetical protein
VPDTPTYKLIGQDYVLPDMVGKVTGRAKYSEAIGAKGIGEPAICAGNAAIGDDFLRRTPATPSMIVASLDAGKRVDERLVTHV